MIRNLAICISCVLVVSLDAIPVDIYQRNIPVEIRYDNQIVQVIPRDVQARRNLDAKVQLNPNELGEVLKHLPLQVEPDVLGDAKQEDKLQLTNEDDISSLKTFVAQEVQKNVELPSEEASKVVENIPAVKSVSQPEEVKNVENGKEETVITPGQVVEDTPSIKSLLQPEENVDIVEAKAAVKSGQVPGKSLEKVLQESQQIITSGLQNLKESFKPSQGQLSPNADQWASLEKAVDEYFDEEKQKLLIRQTVGTGTDTSAPVAPSTDQNQSNWIQNVVNGFNGIASNFVQSIQSLGGPSNSPAPQGQGDEGTPQQPVSQGFQGFIQYFNDGITNILNTVSGNNNAGPTTSNTNLSDSGASPTPGGPIGFFGTIVSNVQNALGIQQQGQPPAAVQGDTGAPVQQQQNGPVQIIQSVGNAISNLFQGGGTQPKPPGASSDESSPPAQPANSNIIQNIQNAIQNSPFNPFRPQGSPATNPNQVENGGNPSPQSSEGVKKPVVEVVVEEQPLADTLKPVKENEIIKKEIKTVPLAIA